MFNIVETPGTSIYVQSESAGPLKLVQVALGSSGTELPTQSGNAGKVLGTDGDTLSWVEGGGLPEQSGHTGQVLHTDGATPYWAADTDAFPSISGHSNEILSNDGAVLDWRTIDSFLPAQSGHSNEVLITVGGVLSWVPIDALPVQSGKNGYYLTTDGADPYWAPIDALPSQSGNSGKILTTNGSTPSWEVVPTELPAQSGYANNFLTTDGNTPYWAMPSGWTAYTADSSALPVGGTLTVTHPADPELKRVVQGLVMSTPSTPSNWWRLEETTGTTAYATTGALNLSYASVTLAQTGKFGYGAFMGANGARVMGPKSFASMTAFTIDFWLKSPSTFGDARSIFSVAATATNTAPFLGMKTNGTSGATLMYFGGGWNVAGPKLVASTWQHITVTWDGATLKTYLDGVLFSTYASSGSNQSTGTNVYFGYSMNLNSHLYCTYDNIMIFDNYAMPVEAISTTETYSYGGAWQPMQLGTANGQIEVTYTSDTTTSFTSHLLETHNVKVEVLL